MLTFFCDFLYLPYKIPHTADTAAVAMKIITAVLMFSRSSWEPHTVEVSIDGIRAIVVMMKNSAMLILSEPATYVMRSFGVDGIR